MSTERYDTLHHTTQNHNYYDLSFHDLYRLIFFCITTLGTDIPDEHTPSNSHDRNTNSTASNYERQLSEYTEETHQEHFLTQCSYGTNLKSSPRDQWKSSPGLFMVLFTSFSNTSCITSNYRTHLA